MFAICSCVIAFAVALMLACAPRATNADESTDPAPALSPNCRNVEPVKFLSHGDPVNGFSKVVCTVDYWVCGRKKHQKSDPVDNKPGACNGFTTSVKKAIGSTACCDQ